MTKIKLYMFNLLSLLVVASIAHAQSDQSIDPDALIRRILAVDSIQREQVQDVMFDAELIEGEHKKDGFQEKERFVKKVYLKYLKDTILFRETYLEYYKHGKRKDDKELKKKARERQEYAHKRKTRNIAFPLLQPFKEKQRDEYLIEYRGVAEKKIEGLVCYEFGVTSKVKDAEHINGTYYFEAEGFHLVRCDFSPARLPKRMMFKMKQLDMSILFGPAGDKLWLPKQFDIRGRGKAMFVFGVKFAATEQFRNPVVNSGLSAQLFEVDQTPRDE